MGAARAAPGAEGQPLRPGVRRAGAAWPVGMDREDGWRPPGWRGSWPWPDAGGPRSWTIEDRSSRPGALSAATAHCLMKLTTTELTASFGVMWFPAMQRPA